MEKLRNLGLAFVVLGLIEASWGLFCIFGGLLLGLVGFADEQMGVLLWAGGGAYAVLALLELPIAAFHLWLGSRLRAGKGSLIPAIAGVAVCLVQLVFALYCFPFELGVLIYGVVVLADADARKALDEGM